jgi:hypothetical protein
MKNVLVRDGRHMRPTLAVLKRYGLGSEDQYARGRWIAESDLPTILKAIRNDPGAIRIGAAYWDWGCPGTNQHNYVRFSDFKELFK